MYHISFVCSTVSRHELFWWLVVTPIWTEMCKYMFGSLFSVLLNISLVMKLLGYMAIIPSKFCKISELSTATISLYSFQHVHEGSKFSTTYQHLPCSWCCCWRLSFLIGVYWYFPYKGGSWGLKIWWVLVWFSSYITEPWPNNMGGWVSIWISHFCATIYYWREPTQGLKTGTWKQKLKYRMWINFV